MNFASPAGPHFSPLMRKVSKRIKAFDEIAKILIHCAKNFKLALLRQAQTVKFLAAS